jgi:hypothetical protein
VSARILVTDAEHRAALAVVRSLGRAGYQVIAAGSGRWPIGCASRHAGLSVRVPDPGASPEAFRRRILELTATVAPDLVLPVTEAAILALLPERRGLGPARLPLPPDEVVRRVLDKREVLAAAASCGIAVPAQAVLEDAAALAGTPLPPLPNVLKGARSLEHDGTHPVKTPRAYADSGTERERAITAFPPAAFPLLVQQRIVGEGTGVFVLLWQDRVLATFCHRRIREKPPAGGVSTCCESVPPDPGLIAASVELLRRLEWSGVAMVEFKRDAASGVPYLMEINGRFWGSLQLAVDAGVDFPALFVRAALGEAVEPVTAYRTGIRSRWWWGDVDHLLARLRRGGEALHLPPDAPSTAWTAFEVLRLGAGQRGDVGRLSDPLPFVAETLAWFGAL